MDENFMAKVAEFGLSKTALYLDQTHVLCGIPLIDPYMSRERHSELIKCATKLVNKAKIEETMAHSLDGKVKLEEIRLYCEF
ncbi:hypothetical protein Bca4012_058730 [Brassica carinata]